ncbi:MAG: hypothetical protein KAS11_06245, partial [Candidatus Aenigmarchaeota archaeon]|nr:hypothetical protein [Candidatus Aenigmarchaeota archaeon]
CVDTYASDGDGSKTNFTIDNVGDSVDVFAYVTSDFDASKFMICSSSDSDTSDDASCTDPPSEGVNGADNLQVYVNVSGSWGWYSIPRLGRDGSDYMIAVDCDVPAATNATGIDFKVRAPYGTIGAYGTTVTFVTYDGVCSDGQEGLYFTP